MKSLLVLFVAMAFFATGEALKCYSCLSPDSGCVDPIDKSAVKEKTCVQPLNVCRKTTAELSNGTTIATRGCDSLLYIDRVSARATANVSVVSISSHFCDEDLCNGVSSTSAALSMLMVLAVPLAFRNYY